MPHVIDAEKCVGCGACQDGCPQKCISFNGDGKSVIDAGNCIDCGCCKATCDNIAQAISAQ